MYEDRVLNYAQEQRLRMIDFLLFSYGRLNRQMIMNYFAIGAATATRDFKAYKELSSVNIVYDESAKVYLKGANFKRIYK